MKKMSELKPIKVYLQNDKPLVWSARDSVELREQWRIVGCLVGCLPRLPRQNNHLGLPLQLSKEEVTLLLEKGVIVLLNNNSDLKSPSEEEMEEFNRYREKSYQAQVEMFREERKKEIHQNMANIIEGKREKAQKELRGRKRRREVPEEAERREVPEEVERREGPEEVERREVPEEAERREVPEEVERREGPEEVERREVPEEGGEVQEDFSIDVDKVHIPPIPKKFSLVQLFTESPYKPDEEVPAAWSYPQSANEHLKYGVYRDLWNQGYFLSNGSKFGGDFLVYPGDPSRYHSHYIAICIPHDKKMSALDIVSMGRLGSNVRKTVLVCSEGPDNKISYTSVQWTGIS